MESESFEELLGLPMQQQNARVQPGLTMRVGIPHKAGSLAAHAFREGYPAMVSSSAFWNRKLRRFSVPEYTDLHELDWCLDSAGFVACSTWGKQGKQPGMAGVYPWTYQDYAGLVMDMKPTWWSSPDLACEPALASNEEERIYRIRATATLLEGMLQTVFWIQEELSKTMSARAVANMIKPPCPILQGFTVDEYLLSLELTEQVWRRWEPWVAPPRLIGIGSVCRRDLHHPKHGLYALLRGLDGRLPEGSSAHLFGVKGAALDQLRDIPWVASCDSMAFDVASRIEAHREGRSNTMAHRQAAMSKWMASAHHRLARLRETRAHPVRA